MQSDSRCRKELPVDTGGIDSPITAPGKTVTIRLNPACDTASLGFDAGTPANNIVTITFEPPGGGGTTDVVVAPVTVDDAITFHFTMPSTALVLPPHALAGPARIRVRNPGDELLAEIGSLFQPTSTCDREPETIHSKCDAKLSQSFAAAESSAGGACPTEGDLGAMQDLLTGDADFVRLKLDGVRFIDNGDGTVTDTDTGLMWEKKDDGGSLHDRICECHALVHHGASTHRAAGVTA